MERGEKMIKNDKSIYNPKLNPFQKDLVRELVQLLAWQDVLNKEQADRISEIEQELGL